MSDSNPNQNPLRQASRTIPSIGESAGAQHNAPAETQRIPTLHPDASGNATEFFAPLQADIPTGQPPFRDAQRKETPDRKRRRGLIALGIVGGLILAAYAGGVAAFANIYYPNTSIAGVDVSLMNRETAVTRVNSSVANYKLTLTGDGFSWEYKPESGADLIDADELASRLLERSEPFAWPIRLASALGRTEGTDAPAASGELPDTFDEEGFTEAITAAVDAYNEGKTGTFDGASAFDAEEGRFTLAKARSNIRLNRDAVAELAKRALAALEPSAELDSGCYEAIAGGATDEDIQAACDAANELISHTITLTMGGTAVATLDAAHLTQYVSFGDDLKPSFDAEALTGYLKEFTLEQTDTVGTERTYTRADGKVVTVSGGTFGWNVNSAELAKQVNDALAKEGDAVIEVPTYTAGDRFTKRGERDWGAYIDIDLSEQYARYYDESDKLIWESGCITGNPNLGNDTPTGIYHMNQCLRNITLIGKTDPETGEPIYKTPVDYWMPFVGGAIGLHDADWQASGNFGVPDIEYSVGSHGCVNLPPAKAGELFGMVSAGLCVIVHN